MSDQNTTSKLLQTVVTQRYNMVYYKLCHQETTTLIQYFHTSCKMVHMPHSAGKRKPCQQCNGSQQKSVGVVCKFLDTRTGVLWAWSCQLLDGLGQSFHFPPFRYYLLEWGCLYSEKDIPFIKKKKWVIFNEDYQYILDLMLLGLQHLLMQCLLMMKAKKMHTIMNLMARWVF